SFDCRYQEDKGDAAEQEQDYQDWHSGTRVSAFAAPRAGFERAAGELTWPTLDGDPSPAAQAALLGDLRAQLTPLLAREGLPLDFGLAPGTRLRRAYGRCTWRGNAPPLITVRCTADSSRSLWRRRGAILGTLLH